MDNDKNETWSEEKKAEKVKEIRLEYAKGGSMSHNIVTSMLQSLAKHDKELSARTFKELEDIGF